MAASDFEACCLEIICYLSFFNDRSRFVEVVYYCSL